LSFSAKDLSGLVPIRHLWFLGMWVAVAFLHVAATANADGRGGTVRNVESVFQRISPCSEYESLLNGEASAPSPDCHAIENFIISGSELNVRHLLERMEGQVSPDSSLGSLVGLLLATLSRDPVAIYNSANLASGRMALQLAASGDLERAAVYSNLSEDIRLQSVVKLCRGNTLCDDLMGISSMSRTLGEEFAYLDGISPDGTSYCLLRSDGYTVPIRNVIQSKYFNKCIEFFQR